MKQDASSSSSNSGTATLLARHAVPNDLWPLIVQQDSIKRDLRTVCALLCSSRALRAEMLTVSAGQLDCCIGRPPCTPSSDSNCNKTHGNRYHHLTHWISKHGQLLRTLDFSRTVSPFCGFPAEAAFAAALATAAMGDPEPAAPSTTSTAAGPVGQAASCRSVVVSASSHTQPASSKTGTASASPPQKNRLLLQEVSAHSATSAAILQHLSASHLTKLTFSFDNVPEERAAGAALARLTALQELDISGSFHLSEDFMSAVAELTNLVKLELPRLFMAGVLCVDWLPPQLQQLHLQDFGRDDVEDCLQLGQMTALTRLQHGRRKPQTSQLLLQRGDVLPPNLVVLDAELGSLEPVLQLQHLQQLNLVMPGAFSPRDRELDLQHLTQLQALTHLGLDYAERYVVENYVVENYADADEVPWTLLPVKQLAIGKLYGKTLNALSQLQGLTSLQLGTFSRRKPCQLHASYGKLVQALQQLTSLQKLWWKDVEVGSGQVPWSDDVESHRESEGDEADSSGPGWALLRAIATHPLRSVTFIGTVPGCERGAVTVLRAATGLTYLKLCRCGVQDADVILLAQHLTALQSLTVRWEGGISSAVLPAVCSSLTQLTALDLSRTAVSDNHLHCLTGLQSLRVLDLDETCVTKGGAVQLYSLTQLVCLSVSRRRVSRAKVVS